MISYKRRAVYYETDRMKIVHHSNYIRYFEEARINFMHEIGCDVLEMENKGLLIPNVDAYARYLKPIRFSDEFNVDVKLTQFTGSRMVFANGRRKKFYYEKLGQARYQDCYYTRR